MTVSDYSSRNFEGDIGEGEEQIKICKKIHEDMNHRRQIMDVINERGIKNKRRDLQNC